MEPRFTSFFIDFLFCFGQFQLHCQQIFSMVIEIGDNSIKIWDTADRFRLAQLYIVAFSFLQINSRKGVLHDNVFAVPEA